MTELIIAAWSASAVLQRGDLVLIRGVDKAADLEVGDIIAFQDNVSGLVIHRVIAIDGDTITTQGDANLSRDRSISFDRVIGRAFNIGGRMAKLPYLGNIPILLGGTTTVDSETVDTDQGQVGSPRSEPASPVDAGAGVGRAPAP